MRQFGRRSRSFWRDLFFFAAGAFVATSICLRMSGPPVGRVLHNQEVCAKQKSDSDILLNVPLVPISTIAHDTANLGTNSLEPLISDVDRSIWMLIGIKLFPGFTMSHTSNMCS